MEIIIIIIGVIIVGLLIYLLTSTKNQKEELTSLQTLSTAQNILLQEFEAQKEKTIGNDERLDEKIKQVQEILSNIKKDSTQDSQKIQDMFQDVRNMNNIMINKKTRGNWGEYQLNNLLSIYAGESKEIFESQYLLTNGYIGDVALHLPDTEKVLIIDSKFPLENYVNITKCNELEVKKYQTLFKTNIKKHINDISNKYVTNQTMESAVMFIPSEAIYFYICSECGELIDYAHSKHILITSPTTLLGVVFTLVNLTKDMNRTKNIQELEKVIVGMYDDALRLQKRLLGLNGISTKLQQALKDTNTSADKIVKKIVKIHDGYLEEENIEESKG